jgi:hypothetical protein
VFVMRQEDESRRGWPRSWIGIVASVAVGGSLLALGVWANAPALAAWGCLNLVAALGVSLRTTWGLLLEALLGIVLCAITGFVAAFSVLMMVSEGRSLDDPMFGTGIAGVLNGWASLALYGLLIAAGIAMIAAAWRGMKDRPVAAHR